MILLLQNLLIVVGLTAFTFLSWRKIELGIYAIIFFLPLYLVRMEIFGIPTTLLEIGIYILFAVWLIKNYHLGEFKKATDLVLSERLFAIGATLLFAGVIISTALSAGLKTSAGILKGWFFDPILFFIIFISTIDTYEKRIGVLKTFAYSGFAVAAISLAYWFRFLEGGVSYDARLHGFYSSPNYLAMYLAAPFIIAVWSFLKTLSSGSAQNIRKKYFWLAAMIMIAMPIYLTYSYAAWLAIAVAIFLMFYLMLPSGKRILFSVSLVLISALLIFSQIGTSKFENLKNLSYRSSTNSRLMIWRAAWLIGMDHPVFGIGPGNFQKYYLDYQKKFPEPYLEWAVPEPHNVFLAFWLQAGILGLVGFGLILYWFFGKSFSLIKKARLVEAGKVHFDKSIALTAILLPVAVYIVVHGLFDTTYWKNDLSVIFWMILGLMLMVGKKR